jgi:hypothetical protein
VELRTDLTECPHCHGKTALQPDARLRWVCAACGGPRVPGGPLKSRALARARVAQAAAFGWSAGAIALAVSGAFTAGLAALLFGPAMSLGIAIGVVGALMLLFAWRASARAGARRKELAASIEDAWREGARAILAQRGRDTTPAQLAEAMQIDEGEADELLTSLAAHDEARIAIDGGDVKYRIQRESEEAEEEEEDEAAPARAKKP